MAGRPRGIWTPDVVRARIKTTKLMERLQKYALGQEEQGKKVELSTSQIRAIEILLRKAVPDLSSVEHSGEIAHTHTTEMSEAELERIAAGGSPRAAGETSSTH